MNKDDFNKLGILDQLAYVNTLLLGGESLRSISTNLNMSKTTIRDRFKKLGYWFDADKRQYVKEHDQSIMKVLQDGSEVNSVDLIEKQIKEISPQEKIEEMFGTPKNSNDENYKSNTEALQELQKESYKNNTKVLPKDNGSTKVLQEFNSMKNDLLELIENKNELMDMLKYYKSNANIIEVPQLDINDLPAELVKDAAVNKSIKVNEAIWKLFNEACNQYENHKKKDLVNLALYEFYKKYKK